VQFIGAQKQTPVNYVMGLFGKYDIVVLCERAHPETTQYDMIFELASDKRFQQQLGQRDKIVADNAAAKFNEIQKPPGSQKKALVIMNYRHAFTHFRLERGGKVRNIENMTGFLMAACPGKVANVMINATGLIIGGRDNPAGATAIQNGKWDAAFAVAGNPSLGFDFKGSPLGDDPFDYFPFPIPVSYTYQDVFTGFVFYKPLSEHRMSFGVPGLLDPEFTAELVRRSQITGRTESVEELTKEVRQWVATVRVSSYDNKEIFPKNDCEEKIQQWLKQMN